MKNVNSRTYLRYLGPDPDPNAAPPAPPPPPEPKRLTEAEVNAIVQKRLGDENKKFAAERAQLLDRVAKLEPDAQKAAELQSQVEEIQRVGKTAAELLEIDRKKERARLEEEAKKSAVEAARWREKHHQQQFERDLADAASTKEADAFNPRQLVAFLRPAGKIVPKKDAEGKVLDELETRVHYTKVDAKTGFKTELDLTPAEAIKLMQDDPDHGNFFRSKVTGGIGGGQPGVLPGMGGKAGLTQDEFTKHYLKGTLPKD